MRTERELFELVRRRAGEMQARRRRRQGAAAALALVAAAGAVGLATLDGDGDAAPVVVADGVAAGPDRQPEAAADPGTNDASPDAFSWESIWTTPIDIAGPGRYLLTTEPLPIALLEQLTGLVHGTHIQVGIGMPADTDSHIEAVPSPRPPEIVRIDADTFVVRIEVEVTAVMEPYRAFSVRLG